MFVVVFVVVNKSDLKEALDGGAGGGEVSVVVPLGVVCELVDCAERPQREAGADGRVQRLCALHQRPVAQRRRAQQQPQHAEHCQHRAHRDQLCSDTTQKSVVVCGWLGAKFV